MHHAVLPQERETRGTGGRKPKRRETAEILPFRVRTKGLGFARDLAPLVDANRHAVRSFESGGADIQLPSLVPKDTMECVVGESRGAADQAVIGDDERLAGRADGTEVGDRKALWVCNFKRGEQTGPCDRRYDGFHMSLHTRTRRLRPGTITQGAQ